jgi:peptide subunit release factor 1 (eRF1)
VGVEAVKTALARAGTIKPQGPAVSTVLDSLLGRRQLNERIDELEDERDRLSAQLEAESERRSEAVSDRQAAEERVNRLEDRIADLKGQLESATAAATGDDAALAFRAKGDLRSDRLEAVLDRLESVDAGAEGALTAVLDADADVPEAVDERFGDHANLVDRATPCVVYGDDAGLVSVALRAPLLPSPQVTWDDAFVVDREWFQPIGKYALAVVRSDLFAVGVYDGRERTDYEGFESDVMNDHSKGGYSQGRFERRRDEQIDTHLTACHEAIEAIDADRLIVVGQDPLIEDFADSAVRTSAVDATGAPREALEAAHRSFWTTRLFAI